VEARGPRGRLRISDLAGIVRAGADRGDVRWARVVGGNARLEDGPQRPDPPRWNVKGKIDVPTGRGSDIEMERMPGRSSSWRYTGTLEFKNLAKPYNSRARAPPS